MLMSGIKVVKPLAGSVCGSLEQWLSLRKGVEFHEGWNKIKEAIIIFRECQYIVKMKLITAKVLLQSGSQH